MSPIAIVIGFLTGAVLVVLAGVQLARMGDVIAARTKLGGLWVGSVFLAVATSLPELATDISAIRLGAPDLAAGDLFGSSMANMLILAIVGLLPGTEIFRRAALDNVLAAALAIALTAAAAVFVLLRLEYSVLGAGLGSLVLAGGYVAGIRTVFRNSALAREAGGTIESGAVAEDTATAPSLRRALGVFLGASLVILFAAPLFAASATELAELTGLGTSLVGTWLVGFATSLPELVTSIAAVRMRAYDLAAGNLFGSNAVNMLMFVPLDLAHRGEPIFAAVSPVHALTALVAIALMAIGIAALAYRSTSRFRVLEPSSTLMILVYAAGILLLFTRR
jgi:cation:H+ antiporter